MRKKGFTLIEVVVSVTLLLIIIVGGYQGFAALYRSIAYSHARATAVDLSNEYFETIKNLPYGSVGTVGGTPVGIIPVSQTMVRDNITLTITTVIQNVNDLFDGAPDSFPNDYKLVELTITCTSCTNFIPVVISSYIAPANLESA